MSQTNSTTLPSAPKADKSSLVPTLSADTMAAFRRGDRVGLIRGVAGDVDKLAPEQRLGLERLADLAIETRRQSVSVLGSHEAFVRRTPHGDLLQVVRPVPLSIADKTLYQILVKRPFKTGTDERWQGQAPKNDTRVEWREVPINGGPNTAELTMPGYNRLNGVAGCAVGQPPTVVVDGERRTNPFVERHLTKTGRLGDIVRVVIGVTVVGPAPATGNPVVLTYTLDYDPAKDLHHLLGEVNDKHPDHCILVDEEDFAGEGHEKKRGWKYTPLFGGVGWYHDLGIDAVRDAYKTFTNILQNAVKKAQTVARRNAMRSHPALAVQTVEMDANKRVIVPVIGWAGDQRAMTQWTRLQEALAAGDRIPSIGEVETIDVSGDSGDAVGGDDVLDVDSEQAARARGEQAPTVIDAETAERHRLISQIDQGLPMLSPKDAGRLGYDPAKQTAAELRAVLVQLNGMIDTKAGE